MNDLAFDPETFMNEQTEEAMSTTIEPCPPGDYAAVVDDVEPPRAVGEKGSIVMRIWWNILDEGVLTSLDRESVRVPQSVWLDVTDDGRLATSKGKNVGLGRVREALDLNQGAFSINMLRGAGPAMVSVTHRPDSRNPGDVFSEVKQVGKLS